MGVHVIKNGATESGPVDITDNTFQMERVCTGTQVAAICGDDGGWVRTCTGNTIDTIYVGAGISIYQPASSATTITISNNSITDVYGISLEITGLEVNGGTPTVIVANNYIENGCLNDTVDTEALRLRNFTVASAVSVYYNIVNGTYDGANAHHGIQNKGADGAKIWNNVIYGCDNGIEINDLDADHSTGLDVRNNIVTGNRGYGLNLAASNTITTWGYNAWYDNASGNLNGKAAGTGDVTADPLMTSPATGNFTLQATSPCINAGTDVGLTEDYAGNPIVGLPDIGAYEYQDGGIIKQIIKAILKTIIKSPIK
jgi:NifU-like protein involved in Fe-S cluster formation